MRKQKHRVLIKETESPQKLKELKEKKRKRVRKYRKSLKNCEHEQDHSPGATPYRSRQALGKALKRARHSLPSSPQKKHFVVREIAKSIGLDVSVSPTSAKRSIITEETISLVNDFYNNNDISWQAPGRKDHVIIRETNEEGEKVKKIVQARYLMMSLREAHTKFMEENPDTKIGLSKFCDLRPAHVKLFDHLPHQVCVCSYHENVRLILVALKKYSDLSTDFSSFVNQIVCDSQSKECMSNECLVCKDKLNSFSPQNPSTSIVYHQWQTSNSRVEKVAIMSTVQEAFDELKQQSKHFLLHTYIKRKQSCAFKWLVSECNGQKIILQVDFSENATITAQREIQAEYWSHVQVTIFTAHAWIKEGVNLSIAIVSDDLNHTKYSVYTYMQFIFGCLKEKYASIETIDIFSDGASSQFKQRYLFSNLHSWEMEHDVKLSWNFFATSHGKGVVDGIGGTVKRTGWRHVKAEKHHITSTQEYATFANELCQNILVQYIPKDEVEKNHAFLDVRWDGVLSVPGTQQLHCIKSHGKDKLQVSDITDAGHFNIYQIRRSQQDQQQLPSVHETTPEQDNISYTENPSPPEQLKVGEWVIVNYEGEKFPGEITSTSSENQEVEVRVMHKSGGGWKWPTCEDKIFCEVEDVERKIKPPTAAGHRGQFVFEDFF